MIPLKKTEVITIETKIVLVRGCTDANDSLKSELRKAFVVKSQLEVRNTSNE